MEPRVHQPVVHDLAFLYSVWMMNQFQPGMTPVTTKVFHDVARALWGSDEAGNVSSYEGKALAAKKTQNRTFIKDSLGMCDFAWPISYSYNTPDHVGDPTLESKIFSAVTGVAGTEIDRYAERIFNQQRAIQVREGRRAPEDDYPLEYNFTEPLQADKFGQPVMIPGIDNNDAIDVTGYTLDRGKFTNMLKEYYRLRGYDEETGLPKPETLAALDLDDLADTFR
jgi:aldehyde:ferredoxin oxidoreductase